jgi:hypothetical protein
MAACDKLIDEQIKGEDTQTILQQCGINFLKIILKALYFQNDDLVKYDKYDDPRTRSDPREECDTNHTYPVVRSLIFEEIPRIFKLGATFKDSNIFHNDIIKFDNLLKIIPTIKKKNEKSRVRLLTLYGEYNKYLNRILQRVRSDFDDDADILEKRAIISRMQLIKNYQFDGIDRTRKSVTSLDNVDERETRFTNYDGRPLLSSDSIIMRVPLTIDKSNPKKNLQGVVFGFDSLENYFNMIAVAIENAKIEQLIRSTVNSKFIEYGGCLINDSCVFSIKLSLQHGEKTCALISSTSTKIIHLLSNKSVTHKEIKTMLTFKPYVGLYQTLGLYIKYHNLVVKKIYDLISASYRDPDFPYTLIVCYRHECGHHNIFKRVAHNIPRRERCTKCFISEFCVNCGKTSHGGACDIQPDESSREWIDQNTKPCPVCNSNVLKDGGCNHMSCTCGAHFCWLCNEQYDINEINNHYADYDVYGNCVNINR